MAAGEGNVYDLSQLTETEQAIVGLFLERPNESIHRHEILGSVNDGDYLERSRQLARLLEERLPEVLPKLALLISGEEGEDLGYSVTLSYSEPSTTATPRRDAA